MSILVTGGAGFIGSNFVLDWLAQGASPVVNLDKLTYAGNRHNLDGLKDDARHVFVVGDVGDIALVTRLLQTHQPRAILHFAAESHVDRSIAGAGISSRAISAARMACWRRRARGRPGRPGPRRLPLPACFHRRGLRLAVARCPRLHRIEPRFSPIIPIPPARRPAITWCAPAARRTACRC
ncbi:GDP-mannose 4,6-dehydratase [Achromobacter insuavis]